MGTSWARRNGAAGRKVIDEEAVGGAGSDASNEEAAVGGACSEADTEEAAAWAKGTGVPGGKAVKPRLTCRGSTGGGWAIAGTGAGASGSSARFELAMVNAGGAVSGALSGKECAKSTGSSPSPDSSSFSSSSLFLCVSTKKKKK